MLAYKEDNGKQKSMVYRMMAGGKNTQVLSPNL